MKRIGLFFLVASFVIVSCNINNNKEDLRVIDLAESFDAKKFLNLSDIATEVEYIPLETGNDIMIGRNPVVYATKDFILIFTFRQILQFNREDGAFVREIGQIGNGPEEYTRATLLTPVEEGTQTIFALTNNKRISYSFDGKYKGSILLNSDVADVVKISTNYFAGYHPNFTGNESVKVSLYDSLGNVLSKFRNHSIAPNEENAINVWNPHGWFYKFNNQTYFAELFNDTLYSINSNQLKARYLFNLGRYSPLYKKQNTIDFASKESANHFLFNSIFESERYLFYTFRYRRQVITAAYDKATQAIRFSTPDDAKTIGGIVNDVHNLFPFTLSSITSNDELIGLIDAHKIVQWLSENKLEYVLSPQILNLKQISESDNPLVVIAKLKR
ncbi:MAG: 6-bladed beta-propeller [Tenuifilaceae bacterium]|nr:6-bladed beta-propeller [Tenuifilaceae bacterium]